MIKSKHVVTVQCAEIMNSGVYLPWNAGKPRGPPIQPQGEATNFESQVNENRSECMKQECNRITELMRFDRESSLRCKSTLRCRRALEAQHAGARGETHF